MSQADVMTGAACRVLINGKIIGVSTAITYTRDQGVKATYGIDSPIAQELSITGPYTVRGQINGLRTRSTAGFDGLQVVNASTLSDYFNQKYCTIELVDRKTNITFAKIEKVIFNMDTVQVLARNVITINASFIGTWLSTEITQKSGKA